MPALITHGSRGQAALVSPISGKIGNTIRKRHGLGFWDFQTSQEPKPVVGCLSEEFARPPQTIHTLPLVLLASPTIGGDNVLEHILCGSTARRDLREGCWATGIPTATVADLD